MNPLPKVKSGRLRLGAFVLLTLLDVASFAAVGQAATSPLCGTNILGAEILDTRAPVSVQSSIAFAESTPAFQSYGKTFGMTYVGSSNEYAFDTLTCSVTWHDYALNFNLKATNGSSFNMAIAVNPAINATYNVTLVPSSIGAIALQHSKTYSGYAVAGNSAETQEVNYTAASWVVPTVSKPSNPGCGSSLPNECVLLVWTGLQNSTYDGPDHSVTKGEVIQTGTYGTVTCSSSCTTSYGSWYSYVAVNNGVVKNGTSIQTCAYSSASAGDTVTAQVGSQEVINGTAGNTYYTIIYDFTVGNRACEHAYSFHPNKYGHGTYGKEYFADFFAERPQYGSSYDNLPKFTNTQFYNVEMNCLTCGAYPNYNSGYGFGSYMYNNGFQETTTKPMYENSGSTLGHFYVDWNTSAGISYYLHMQATPSADGSVTPSSGWQNYGSSVTIRETPNSGDRWCYWVGTGSSSYSGTNTQQMITMDSNVTEVGYFASGTCPNSP